MQPGGCGDRDSQCRALDDCAGNHPGDDLSCFGAANCGKGAKRSSLFGARGGPCPIPQHVGKRREGEDGSGEPSPPGLRSEQGAVGETRFRDRGDQRRVVLVDGGNGLSRALRGGRFRPGGGIGKKIELMSGHSTMMRRAGGLSKIRDTVRTRATGNTARHRERL